jgi:hypothetical protein
MKARRLRLADDDAAHALNAGDLGAMRLIASECGVGVRAVYVGGATIQHRDIAAMTDFARRELLISEYYYAEPPTALQRRIEERQAAGIR